MKSLEDADVVSILDFFQDLPDPRCAVNLKHRLGELLVICICGVLCGADGPQSIGLWAQAKQDWLCTLLELPHGVPSHDTIGRVLATVQPAAFQACFASWIATLQDPPIAAETTAKRQIAIDGKALRRSHDKRKQLGPLFLVSAWSVECGVSLGQLATEAKSNEITAIPALLANLDVRRAIVTIDAAGCQKNIAGQIITAGGDYVLALKGNQGNIHQDVSEWMSEQMENDFAGVPSRKLEVIEKGHGREVSYWYTQAAVPASLRDREQWAKLKTIGVVVRHCREGDKVSDDTRYYLSSLPLGIQQFSRVVRGHWAIENTLHWCLDVSFREDDSRLRNRIAADNVAWLKRFAISLMKQVKSKESIIGRRRMAGWNNDFLMQVLTGKQT